MAKNRLLASVPSSAKAGACKASCSYKAKNYLLCTLWASQLRFCANFLRRLHTTDQTAGCTTRSVGCITHTTGCTKYTGTRLGNNIHYNFGRWVEEKLQSKQSGHYLVPELYKFKIGLSVLRALCPLLTAIFSLSLSSLCLGYFSPRRVCPMVLKFRMGS